MIANILSIAGSDPSGGAGIQADLKTFAAHGVYGMAVLAALTAQNTQGVRSVVNIPERFVRDQIAAIFDDIEVAAVKIGMLSNVEIIEAVADSLEEYAPKIIVLDPVMVASSGDGLIDTDAVDALKSRLIPMASLITPNIPEAEKLSRSAVIDMDVAAEKLLKLGCQAALLKGGHLKGDAIDVLATANGVQSFNAERIDTENTHGTGCTLSSAIAANLGKGMDLFHAVAAAKDFVTEAIRTADDLQVGSGYGPLNHNVRSI
ncbi:MAG: bifunctional hydroxymethylpyrimidine kinase/phosphomethylpyrimidine kinase [Micavibrio sp.]|nr:bifunctional hydroxymethylpyrimidine kinase/phosphomethylpyrimidine kinase [Micavibrio sp.]